MVTLLANKLYPFKQFVSAPFEYFAIDFVKPSEITNGRLSHKQEFIYRWHERCCISEDRILVFNWSIPSAGYMRQRIESALVQIMACRLFAAKPLSKPVLGNCELELRNKIQWNISTKNSIHEMHVKISSV